MDEELIVDPKFQKGFNDGYKLAAHEPELANQIVANKNDQNLYFEGLTLGKQEHDVIKAMERIHSMNRNETPSTDMDRGKGKEK